jgi:hypothetical protein
MSSAAPPFDPYREWLGIEPHEQPADFYRLLGVARFEEDLGRIAMAADQRMALVRSFQTGPRGMHTQRLLNELAAARIALISPASKAAYDAALSQHLAARIAPTPVLFHPAYGTAPQPGTAVLTFGLGQTAIPPAPPVLPPAPPPAPIARLNLATPEEDAAPAEPIRAAPWWLPLVLMIVVPLLMLAAVIGYGLGKPYLDARFAAPSEEQPPEGETIPAPAPPEPPPRKAIVLLQEGSGEVFFSPATATLSGAVQLETAGTEELLANWTTADDAAEWHFKLVKPGFFRAEVTYAAIPEAAGAGLELAIGERTKTLDLRPTGGLTQFITDAETVVVSSTGEQTLTLRPVRQPAGAWLVVRSVRLIPPDRLQPGETPPAQP